MTFVALYDREDWGILASDTSQRIKTREPGIPPIASRVIENKAGVSKLHWHAGGWVSFCGLGSAWARRLLPAIDALPGLEPSALGVALRSASDPVMVEIESTTPELAVHIRNAQLWFVLGTPHATVLNWRGDDRYGDALRGRVAACWPPEITDQDAKGYLNECQATLDGAPLREAIQSLARLHGSMARLSGSMKGVSEECEIGILERSPLRHSHIPITDWRRVAAGEIEPVVVNDRASTQRRMRREGDA